MREEKVLEENITYFETPGRDHAEETLRLAFERAKARGISTIALALTRVDAARRAMELWVGAGIKLVVVRDSQASDKGWRNW